MHTKRKVEVAVLSDIHLGTYGSHAQELLSYLKSIDPQLLVLNGDIIDIWNFSRTFFSDVHLQVIQHLAQLISEGKEVVYVTGNHDELLRHFSGFKTGNFQIQDKLILELDGQKAWIFHGDIFDLSVNYAKWMAQLGGYGYDALIMVNRAVNDLVTSVGQPRFSLSKTIKESVKEAVKFVSDFEDTAIDLAFKQNYDVVICGHIHQPQDRLVSKSGRQVRYLNSGDWIENMTALEYVDGDWKLYRHKESEFQTTKTSTFNQANDLTIKKQELVFS
jgi:UDP-2,3-diacylglucosamine pyrophosphatase LpxH